MQEKLSNRAGISTEYREVTQEELRSEEEEEDTSMERLIQLYFSA